MITKEFKTKKYCCFYASDFHLEMILLPYIKNNLEDSKTLIFTQDSLSESVKQVLDRTNINANEKNEILNINWNNNIFNIEEIKNNYTVVINGEKKYIDEINKKILNLELKNVTIINCYNINIFKDNIFDLTRQYDGILNTSYINR